MSECPNCGKQKPTNMYACKPCWFMLPKSIRDDIWKGYREGLSERWGHANERALAFYEKKKGETSKKGAAPAPTHL